MPEPASPTRPPSFFLTLILFNLNAILWLALGLTSLSPGNAASAEEILVHRAMPVAAFSLSTGLFACMIFLVRGSRFAWYASLVILALTTMLILLAGIGRGSLLLSALGLFPVILLLKDRHYHLNRLG